MKHNKGMSYKEAKAEVIKRYARCGAVAKSYVSSRFMLGNYTRMIDSVPENGNVLDFGCGFGQLSMLVRLTGENRVVYGYDCVEERMDIARRAAEDLPETHFLHDRCEIPDQSWNTVMFYDMLHYLPIEAQDELVAEYAERVKPGGSLVIRDVHRSFGPKYAFNSLQERVMVGAGLTLTKTTHKVHFRDLNELLPIIESKGFEARLTPPPLHHPYADYLITAKKHNR